MLATHRLQDGFALANFRFDPETRHVVRTGSAGNGAATRFLVYHEGSVYFEGSPEEIAGSQDPYLKRFLV